MSRFVLMEAMRGVEAGRGDKSQGGQREVYCSGLGSSYTSVPGDGKVRAGQSWQVTASAGLNTNWTSGRMWQ